MVFQKKKFKTLFFQLPVPLAVLFLMYREQLLPCCTSGPPRLLDKDELAMETQQGAKGPDLEQKEHEAEGTGFFKEILFFPYFNLS